MALYVCDIHCELREVVLRDKPQTMLDISPKGTVPVLQLPDGEVLEESLDIMLWALSLNDPLQWLPSDPSEQIELIARNDDEFKNALDRYRYPDRYSGVDALEQRALGYAFLEMLEARLEQHIYLYSDHAMLSDIAIFPFVRQYANTDTDWFAAQPIPRLQQWLSNLVESELFAAVMGKYAQWHEGDERVVFP